MTTEERLAEVRAHMDWLLKTVAELQVGEGGRVTEMIKVADYWQTQAEKARERVRKLEAELTQCKQDWEDSHA